MNKKLVLFLSFFLILINPPFIFTNLIFVGTELRIVLATVLILVLFFSINLIKTNLFEIFFYLLLLLLFSLEFFILNNELLEIFSYYTIFIITYLFYKFLNKNELNFNYFIKKFINFSYILSIISIISFLTHNFSSLNTNLLNIENFFIFSEQKSGYQFGILGFVIYKDFGFYSLPRISTYFFEPLQAGIFFALNLLLAKNLNNSLPRSFYSLNTLAGLLTFSYSFYIIFSLIFFFQMKSKIIKILLALSFFFISILLFVLIDDYNFFSIFKKSSLSDRLYRISIALDIMNNFSFFDFLFGSDVNYKELNYDRGISSGIFIILVQKGYLGLLLVFSLLFFFSKKYLALLIVMVFFLLVTIWNKFYVVWYYIIFSGFAFNKNYILLTKKKYLMSKII